MARIVNLPTRVRHGEGVGGSRVVGWLPVVSLGRDFWTTNAYRHYQQIDDGPGDKKKTAWVNFKRVVWHESMRKLFETIELYSKVGCWLECGDGVVRHIFPLILILAADYEEQ